MKKHCITSLTCNTMEAYTSGVICKRWPSSSIQVQVYDTSLHDNISVVMGPNGRLRRLPCISQVQYGSVKFLLKGWEQSSDKHQVWYRECDWIDGYRQSMFGQSQPQCNMHLRLPHAFCDPEHRPRWIASWWHFRSRSFKLKDPSYAFHWCPLQPESYW